jgi:hypothetical protein
LDDNFSKFVGLYPAENTSTLEFVKAFLSWVGIFGVPKILRSDGGSQFSSDMAERLKYLLKYQHLIIVPYHPQGNSVGWRKLERICERWYMSIVLNQSEATIYILFREYSTIQWTGQLERSLAEYFSEIWSIAMDLSEETTGRNSEDYLLKLREAQSI